MRKLLTAGVIAAGALAGPVVGSLGVSLLATAPATAATTTFDITGNLSKEYGTCTQITFSFSGSDCSWGRNRPAANGTWIGPLFGGANYAADGVKDQVTYIPTVGDNVPQGTASSAANFIPAVDDGKLPATITASAASRQNALSASLNSSGPSFFSASSNPSITTLGIPSISPSSPCPPCSLSALSVFPLQSSWIGLFLTLSSICSISRATRGST